MDLRAKPITLRFYKERLLRVLVHIQQHLDEPLALEELARLACLSPYHFHHVFSGMTGESLAGHVRRLRLERAQLLGRWLPRSGTILRQPVR